MTQFHALNVSDVTKETEDAVSIRLDVPSDLADSFRFRPGQYLTFRMMRDGEEIRRNYSVCSGLDDGELRVAVKKVPDGTFSAYANDDLKPGDRLEVMPPEGRFIADIDPQTAKRYLLVAAGSGITPILSIAKSVLKREPKSEVTLLYGNRSVSNIMFKDELDALKDRYPARFAVVHVLSRQPQDVPLFNGRIDREKCETLFDTLIDPAAIDEFFLCGPVEMSETVREVLIERDIPSSHIHLELFQTADEAAIQAARQKRHDEMGADAETERRVTVIWDGADTELRLAPDGPSILDAALAKRGDMPYSCKGGMCCTCRAKLVSGEVSMDVNYALTDEEIEAGFVLGCQSHPVSDDVVLDFDER